ncbi:acetyl-CoA carboxylase biotin carboxyl carrier protein subunit [Parabacteroides sp. PF5-6]|uniref:acetyl-CoA carboxylase biotin carboxyl carrier protein subunit n=1 Tax=Parabacteroides sp. PF5-6 TaxID=1742403 RepID=UPI0024063FA9|nr:acetyl-CoA carboxylase biotin carboxyl carrier protein subunit [Parabacteroides sp. PF5-6]MDF9831524.1 biotin carboxyl carrier protein [Parabacteroides sp. PF5-6]
MEKKRNDYVDFGVMAGTYKTRLTKKFVDRSVWQRPVAGEVLSNLPGTIIQVLVKEGDTVKEGDLLLIHEAMKMFNRIVAPVSGKVVGIHVMLGDKIGKNHLMVKIQPEEA